LGKMGVKRLGITTVALALALAPPVFAEWTEVV